MEAMKNISREAVSGPMVVGITVGVVVVVVSAVMCHRLLLHPLAAFPGPRAWAASRLPWMRHVMRGTLWRQLSRLHEQYGTVVRIAPGELSINAPAAWIDIYSSRPLLAKEPCSQTPPLNGAHSLFTAAGDDHRRLRGTLVASFTDKTLREQAPVIHHHADELIARLRRELADSASVDIHRFFGYAALDTITHLSYAESLNSLPDRNENEWMARFFMHGRFSTIRMCLCWLRPLDSILDFIILALTRRQRARNWAVFSTKIERRLAKSSIPGQPPDFLTPVMARLADGTITKKELLSHSLASVVANSQLTTVALATSTYLLLRNKDSLRHLVNEIRGAFTSDSTITVQTTQSLPYLEAVLNESLRLRHPTPITLPRVIPPEGRSINGMFIPGPSIVGINLHVIQTSPTYWRKPHGFHPERFLPSTDNRYDVCFDHDVKSAFMPFSTGPRNCIGARLFLAEARVTLAKLLWNFDLTLDDSQTYDWLDKRAFLVWVPKPLQIQLVDRCNPESISRSNSIVVT